MTIEKRKLPRFHITPCQFHSDKNYSVQDISMGGLSIRLVDRSDLPQFSVGAEHHGILKIEGLKIQASFRVIYIRGITIGAEWVKPSAELLKTLEVILNPKHLGQSIKSYPVPDSPNMRWFHTPVGVDLLLYVNEEEKPALYRWILYFHQTFLQWEKDAGLKSGQTLAEDDEGYAHGIVRLETRLLEHDATVDRRLLETAREFIEHAVSVDPSFRTLMKHQIEGNL